jgi:hypothetical protein
VCPFVGNKAEQEKLSLSGSLVDVSEMPAITPRSLFAGHSTPLLAPPTDGRAATLMNYLPRTDVLNPA